MVTTQRQSINFIDVQIRLGDREEIRAKVVPAGQAMISDGYVIASPSGKPGETRRFVVSAIEKVTDKDDVVARLSLLMDDSNWTVADHGEFYDLTFGALNRGHSIEPSVDTASDVGRAVRQQIAFDTVRALQRARAEASISARSDTEAMAIYQRLSDQMSALSATQGPMLEMLAV